MTEGVASPAGGRRETQRTAGSPAPLPSLPAAVAAGDERRAAEHLRAVGLRATRPRLAVLAEVGDRPHATAEEVLSGVRHRLGTVSVQGVYDVLGALTEAGLLRRIEPQRSPARYEVQTGDNHHHAVCRACGTVTDVDCVVGQAPCLDPSSTGGLLVDEAEVVFWGVCASCRRRARRPG